VGQTPFPDSWPSFEHAAPTSRQPSSTPVPTSTILGCISGTVREDTNNDNSGDVVLPGVAITLSLPMLVFLSLRSRTDSSGMYRVLQFALLVRTSSLRSTCQGMPMCLTQRGPTTTVFVCHWARGANSPGHDFVDKRTAGTPAPTPVGQTAVPTSASPAGTPVSYSFRGSNTIP
jgi:hypothetical protein